MLEQPDSFCGPRLGEPPTLDCLFGSQALVKARQAYRLCRWKAQPDDGIQTMQAVPGR